MIDLHSFRASLVRVVFTSVLVIVAAVGLVACGGSIGTADPAARSVTQTPTAQADTDMEMDMSEAATPAAPALGDAGQEVAVATVAPDTSGSGGSVTEVQATVREWAIDLSRTEVPAGRVRFTVANTGYLRHNFTVTDGGSPLAQTPIFGSADGSQVVEVDLKPGVYTIICSLPGHAARGQTVDLLVK